jgi:predicted transcriptional regulator
VYKKYSVLGVIMKDHEIKILDEEDRIFIKSLSSLGMSKNVATTMAYLMSVNEASARAIEISTGLRQPEVSLAMKLMHNQSWVSVRSDKRPGKGRPIKIYSLAAPVDEIISYYENKIYEESQATISAIKKLKVICKKVPLPLQVKDLQKELVP